MRRLAAALALAVLSAHPARAVLIDSGTGTGNTTVTRVPPCGRSAIENCPASVCARSRMPIKPSPLLTSFDDAAASMPRPSSSMTSSRLPERRVSVTEHLRAPLCRATFVSASCVMP